MRGRENPSAHPKRTPYDRPVRGMGILLKMLISKPQGLVAEVSFDAALPASPPRAHFSLSGERGMQTRFAPARGRGLKLRSSANGARPTRVRPRAGARWRRPGGLNRGVS